MVDMNELKEFIIDKMIYYKNKHDELFYNEDSIADMKGEDMDDLQLYEGIIEGLAITLEKLKEIKRGGERHPLNYLKEPYNLIR